MGNGSVGSPGKVSFIDSCCQFLTQGRVALAGCFQGDLQLSVCLWFREDPRNLPGPRKPGPRTGWSCPQWVWVKFKPGIGPQVRDVHVSICQGNPFWGYQLFLTHAQMICEFPYGEFFRSGWPRASPWCSFQPMWEEKAMAFTGESPKSVESIERWEGRDMT